MPFHFPFSSNQSSRRSNVPQAPTIARSAAAMGAAARASRSAPPMIAQSNPRAREQSNTPLPHYAGGVAGMIAGGMASADSFNSHDVRVNTRSTIFTPGPGGLATIEERMAADDRAEYISQEMRGMNRSGPDRSVNTPKLVELSQQLDYLKDEIKYGCLNIDTLVEKVTSLATHLRAGSQSMYSITGVGGAPLSEFLISIKDVVLEGVKSVNDQLTAHMLAPNTANDAAIMDRLVDLGTDTLNNIRGLGSIVVLNVTTHSENRYSSEEKEEIRAAYIDISNNVTALTNRINGS